MFTECLHTAFADSRQATGLPSAVLAYMPKKLAVIAPTREWNVGEDWGSQPRRPQCRGQYLSIERHY